MSKVAFKQCDVERLLRAAKAVGYPDAAVDKLPDGTLRLLTMPPRAPVVSGAAGTDLDAELEAFAREHGDG